MSNEEERVYAIHYLQQARWHEREIEFCFNELITLLVNPAEKDIFSSNADGLDYYAKSITEHRKEFNRAFRSLQKYLAKI